MQKKIFNFILAFSPIFSLYRSNIISHLSILEIILIVFILINVQEIYRFNKNRMTSIYQYSRNNYLYIYIIYIVVQFLVILLTESQEIFRIDILLRTF